MEVVPALVVGKPELRRPTEGCNRPMNGRDSSTG